MGSPRMISAWGVAVLGMLSVATFGQGTHPFVGSWGLNVYKSKFEGLPPLKSETWAVTAEQGGLLRMVIDWVESDGTPGHVDYMTACDGKVRPIFGSADFDAVKYEQLGPREFRSVLLKENKVIEREHYVVSADSNIWWDTDSGYDEHGKPWTLHLIFERRH